MSTEFAIVMKEIGFGYHRKPVLQSLSLNLKKGRYYALLGPNGAGKSTLFALLCQLLRPQAGTISIVGVDAAKTPRQALAKTGVVFQQSTLDLDLTVEQNLGYHAALHGMGASQTRTAITRELSRLDVADKRKVKVRALNGGHRRRVEIARALLHDPEVLLLDEATVGLDIPTRQQINQDLRELCRQKALTVLSSTHLIDDIQPQDHLIVLHKGTVQLDMPCADALSPYSYQGLSELYQQLTLKEEVAA